MELKQLGKTGVMVPEIGIGVWRYSGGVEPLRKGVEAGAALIDTAEAYGTEDVTGQAIKGIRDKVFVASKVSGNHLRHDDVLRAAEASLKRLDCGYMDLYQIHWPNSAVAIAETIRAMEELVDRGMVKHIGVSNFSAAELREAQRAARKNPIVANQVLYSLSRREIENELMEYCAATNVTIIAFTPLDSGRLARKTQYPANPKGMKALESIAEAIGKTLGQVALNWCTSHPGVIAIPKSNRAERILENTGASGWRLTAEQVKLLDEAFAADEDDDWK